MLYLNAHVLDTTKAGFLISERLADYDVVVVVEWGKASELTGLFERQEVGFTAHYNEHTVTEGVQTRQQRSRGAGYGQGVCILVRNSLPHRLVQHRSWGSIVQVGKGVNRVFIAGVYIHPQNSPFWERARQAATRTGEPLRTKAEAIQGQFTAVRDDILELRQSGEQVLLLGDFNARANTMEDLDISVQSLLDSMGSSSPGVLSTHIPSTRASEDTGDADARGEWLIEHICKATGSVLLNGRAPGDEHGAYTFPASRSCLDYGIVSTEFYHQVTGFRVLEYDPTVSDHRAIQCTILLPQPPTKQATQAPPTPRWDMHRKEQYVQALRGDALAAILRGLHSGELDPLAAAQQLAAHVKGAAEQVFGKGTGGKMADGRQAARWFTHCKEEYAAVQQAVRGGNMAQIKACRREFKRVAARWKRHYEEQAQQNMWRTWVSNPRKFWSSFQGPKSAVLGASIKELQSFWGELYGGEGRGALPEAASSLDELLGELTTVAEGSQWYLQGESLNVEFTRAEIQAALKKLHNGRAPGPDCLRSEFFKYATVTRGVGQQKIEQNILVPVLQALYQFLFSQGKYVRAWSAATLSAVFKKGDATCLDNYRAIAVGGVLGKLYAVLLESRITPVAEVNGWRAQGQAGFRPDKSTTDQVFILRNLIEQAQLGSSGRPIFCCFVDFKKAYDRVRRDHLLTRLADLGIHGNMMAAIAQMYWSVPLTPKLGKEVGSSIDSTCGVKQGDPLSPLLFGLFIDELEGWMQSQLGQEAGVLVGALRLYLLLYADDLVLVSRTPEGLQRQLEVLESFCAAKGMEVNLSKTEAVVFRPPDQAYQTGWQWHYKGAAVPVSQEFKYLGIIFHETEGVSVAEAALTRAAQQAMWAMLGRFRVAGIRDVSMKLRLYRALVSPIMEYCSAVWAPVLLKGCSSAAKAYTSGMQKVQNTFLRQLGQLRWNTPLDILHREFCLEPVATYWLRSLMQLWGRLQQADPRSLLGRSIRSALRLAQRGNRSVKAACWAGQVMSVLSSIAAGGRDSVGQGVTQFVATWGWTAPATGMFVDVHERLLVLPETSLIGAWDSLLRSPWQLCGPDPREEQKCTKLTTYHRWFALPLPENVGMAGEPEDGSAFPRHPSNMPGYIRCSKGLSYVQLKNLMRFRTGSHHLAVETGRWEKVEGENGKKRSKDRAHRVCTKCSSYAVEDEVHFLFECPAYAHIRVKYALHLFYALGGVRQCAREGARNPSVVWRFMQQDQKLVASFVSECMEYRRFHAPDVELFAEDQSIDWLTVMVSVLSISIYLGYLCYVKECPWGSWSTPEGDSASSLSPGRPLCGASL